MDIEIISRGKEGESRTLEEFQTECLELFLEKEAMSIEVDPTKLIDAKDKLQHLALKELERSGILKSYIGQTGTISYFLVKEPWEFIQSFDLNLTLLGEIAKIYNSIMPSFMVDDGFFRKLGPLDVDIPIIESVISLLCAIHMQEEEVLEGTGENTYSVE